MVVFRRTPLVIAGLAHLSRRIFAFSFFDFVFGALQLHIWNSIITFPTSAVNHLEIKSLNATTVRRFYFGTPVFTLFLYEILIKFDTQWQF